MLHQVGVSFDLYYDARKHKIKKSLVRLRFHRCSDTCDGLLYLRYVDIQHNTMKSFHNINPKLMLTLEQEVNNRTNLLDTNITRIPNVLENWWNVQVYM